MKSKFSHSAIKSMRTAQRGFTLLELVVVIVIVGILAAVAVPKFSSLATSARIGVMKGVAGSLASGNIAVQAAAVAEGKTVSETGQTVSACGGTVSVKFGYAADVKELLKCVDLNPRTDFKPDAGAETSEIQHAGNTACKVTYTAPAALNGAPTYDITAITEANCG